MGPELLKMAESLAVVVESLCVLADIQKSENAGIGVKSKEKTETGWMLERKVRKVRRMPGQRKRL